jgi:hypothetical protein
VQDDHMVVLEEKEEAKAIVKEAQALEVGMDGTLIIEPLLDPLLFDPPLNIKVDGYEELPLLSM